MGRRRFTVLMITGLLVGAMTAGCGASGRGGGGTAGAGSSAGAPPATTVATGSTAGNAPPRPGALVAVSAQGALVMLDAGSGRVLRRLVDRGVVGDAVALSPDDRTVYFETNAGCGHQIWRIAVTGGAPAMVASMGSRPALSPDGTRLAYAVQYFDCWPPDGGIANYAVVAVNLATGARRSLPMSPALAASGLPAPVTHLSWSADGSRLAVSIGSAQDNEGWRLVTVNPATDSYYVSETSTVVPIVPADAVTTFYYEGVYLPNGNVFAVRQCCSGFPPETTSVGLPEINPVTGASVRQVATGLTGRTHTSLAADTSGRWLLYLSGADLEISLDRTRPTTLASGYVAADW